MLLDRYIAELQRDITLQTRKLQQLQELSEQFPDLTRHVDRWGNERFCSASLNGRPDLHYTYRQYHHQHVCGCCVDDRVMLIPYCVIADTSSAPIFELYTDPWSIDLDYTIDGSRCGETNFEKELQEAGFHPDFIAKVLPANQPTIEYDELEEE